MKKKIAVAVATMILLASTMTGCASLEREINRHVIAYSHNGEKLGEWTGKIDIQTNVNGTKVLFDINGKRIALYNAIVITEEV